MSAWLITNSEGELVSSGTVVADPLPAGLVATEITDEEYQLIMDGAAVWDAEQRALVAMVRPPTPEERLDRLEAAFASATSFTDLKKRLKE